MTNKKPTSNHREIAEAIVSGQEAIDELEGKKSFLPSWLKIELYNLLFSVLPYVIAIIIWVVILAVIYLYSIT